MLTDSRDTTPRLSSSQHPRFTATDSDITVESSDLISFKLHRKNLRAHAGTFPLPEKIKRSSSISNSAPAKIKLTEPAAVLEVVFEYLYPNVKETYSDLEGVDFELLLAISGAVEKYQVFAATHLCLVRLRQMAEDHPLEIFFHAIKHGLPDLIDKAASYIVFYSALEVCKGLPAHAAVPWHEYREAIQKAIFSDLKKALQDIKMESSSDKRVSRCKVLRSNDAKTEALIAFSCQCFRAVEVWVGYLESLPTLAELERHLGNHPGTGVFCARTGKFCSLRHMIEKSCKEGLQTAKSIKFTSFLFNKGKVGQEDDTSVVRPSPSPQWHPRFKVPGDIIVESSDLTSFGLHRKNLQTYGGAFPLTGDVFEIPSTNLNPAAPKIKLSEPASVLETVFEYLYPKAQQRHPDLENVDFRKLLAISDAVEKYQVFAAKHLCRLRLRQTTKDHPLEIFYHAIKHDLPSLMDGAAPYIVFYPGLEVIKHLPTNATIPWLAYKEAAWRAVFSASKAILQDIKVTIEQGDICWVNFNNMTVEGSIKFRKCKQGAKMWVGYLESLSTFAELEVKLQYLKKEDRYSPYTGLFCSPLCGLLRCIEESCVKGVDEAKAIKFTSFLYKEGAEPE